MKSLSRLVAGLIVLLFNKDQPKIIRVDYLVEESHTYVIIPEEDKKGKRIAVPFTNDAEAAAFLIGYSAKLQEMANGDGKYLVCPKLERTMVNYLIGTNKEAIQKILKSRNNGEERAEHFIKSLRSDNPTTQFVES